MSIEELLKNTEPDQISSMNFGRKLLHDFMRKNTIEGMTIQQSVWVFSRLENISISQPWGDAPVDLFKMFYSGAIPSLYYVILKIPADDMTEAYHWLTQERIDWVKNQLKEYLGEDVSLYIENLP